MLTIFTMVLFSSCRYNRDICLECTITIAGIEDAQPVFCGDRNEIDDKEAEYQRVVDRENSIVGQSATMKCNKVWE